MTVEQAQPGGTASQLLQQLPRLQAQHPQARAKRNR